MHSSQPQRLRLRLRHYPSKVPRDSGVKGGGGEGGGAGDRGEGEGGLGPRLDDAFSSRHDKL